jgi:isocitrate/isopropylmalate dehydrogenase
MGSEDMAGKPNRVAATVRDSPTQQQLDLYYIREAVQGICHGFEESAKNHNDSTECLEEGRRHREQRVRLLGHNE